MYLESHRWAGDRGDTQLTVRLGSENSALCVTTLDPKSATVQMAHLRTKSTFIIITSYAVIGESSLPSVVLNNQKAYKLEMHIF